MAIPRNEPFCGLPVPYTPVSVVEALQTKREREREAVIGSACGHVQWNTARACWRRLGNIGRLFGRLESSGGATAKWSWQ
eukprot:3551714-Amphidinium_carterae.1